MILLSGGGAGLLAIISGSNNSMSDDNMSIAKEALRQTELRLEDLEKFAAASDRRATATTAIFSTASGVALLNLEQLGVFWLDKAPGVMFAVCAFLSAQSAVPRSYHSRGHFFADWEGHITENDSYYEAVVSQAKENDQRIIFNEGIRKEAAKKTKWAMSLGFWTFCFYAGASLFQQLMQQM